jgi:ABC-2 type transport system ATP-binding protein
MAPLIEFRSVTKRYPGGLALDGLSLTVEPGSVYGLLGRNGAGKTTALRMIAGMESPSSGEVLVFGKNPRRLDDLEKAMLGYAGDGQILPPHLKVSQVMNLVGRATPEWDGALCRAILEEGGIPLDRKVRALSKGMKQRLRLALAYARWPRVLVLDEPAEGLDTVVRFDLFARILDVVAAREACAIVSSHVLGDVERIADRIGFISRGRLLMEGSLDDLKEGARRIRVAWGKRVDPASRLAFEAEAIGALSYRQSGRQASFVTGKYSEAWLSSFRQTFHQCSIETDPLNLEEIFVEILKDE